ncbi:hypothetical protein [Methylocystis heyeri]|uniref:Uncharacterized protein n=1 Tax=Methylocystis heyeri TaxID=391905 RepID=A0A6B8KH83_9HYPH|nr:hypothetical protein [Methylocystis heyeri]QGM45843.1 hypothetical protein H2LOC_009090 [Methylocystis heyeri]
MTDQLNINGVATPVLDPGGYAPAYAAYSPTPASLFVGQIKIATTGAAVALPSQALLNGVVVKAKISNAGNGFVGAAGVTTTDDGTGAGYRLLPGEAWSGAVLNASSIYVNGTAGDVYYYTGN